MKKILSILLLLLLVLNLNATELYNKLMAIKGVRSVEELDKGFFQERYVVMFEQFVNSSRPEAGKFEQRIIIGHVGFNNPNLMITEGYGAAYALNNKFRHEISKQLNANQIFVEHRYFGESTPSPRNWNYLTGENAAADLHAIREAFRSIYTHKWIASGISKGGQNALIYRTLYPDDVDVTVDYVGPVCFGLEDGRHESFMEQVGTKHERSLIHDFQIEVLKRRSALMPMMAEYAKVNDLKFRIPLAEVYDYCVLEYQFTIWQMGTTVGVIPSCDASHDEIFEHFINISSPKYFEISDEPSFFVQAAAELGYYGYDTKPFEGLLVIKNAKGYVNRIFIPEDAQKIKFSDRLARKITNYLKNNDPKLICIYGQNDPWTAVAPSAELFEGKHNMKLYVEPQGCHKARINTLPDEQRDKVWAQIENWIL